MEVGFIRHSDFLRWFSTIHLCFSYATGETKHQNIVSSWCKKLKSRSRTLACLQEEPASSSLCRVTVGGTKAPLRPTRPWPPQCKEVGLWLLLASLEPLCFAWFGTRQAFHALGVASRGGGSAAADRLAAAKSSAGTDRESLSEEALICPPT